MSIKSIVSKTLKFALPALMAATVGFASPGEADAQVIVRVGYPGPEVIATMQPEYFEGHPAYYYNNNWYYRDHGGRWAYYRHEPEYLRGRRNYWVDHRYGGRGAVVGPRYRYRR